MSTDAKKDEAEEANVEATKEGDEEKKEVPAGAPKIAEPETEQARKERQKREKVEYWSKTTIFRELVNTVSPAVKFVTVPYSLISGYRTHLRRVLEMESETQSKDFKDALIQLEKAIAMDGDPYYYYTMRTGKDGDNDIKTICKVVAALQTIHRQLVALENAKRAWQDAKDAKDAKAVFDTLSKAAKNLPTQYVNIRRALVNRGKGALEKISGQDYWNYSLPTDTSPSTIADDLKLCEKLHTYVDGGENAAEIAKDIAEFQAVFKRMREAYGEKREQRDASKPHNISNLALAREYIAAKELFDEAYKKYGAWAGWKLGTAKVDSMAQALKSEFEKAILPSPSGEPAGTVTLKEMASLRVNLQRFMEEIEIQRESFKKDKRELGLFDDVPRLLTSITDQKGWKGVLVRLLYEHPWFKTNFGRTISTVLLGGSALSGQWSALALIVGSGVVWAYKDKILSFFKKTP